MKTKAKQGEGAVGTKEEFPQELTAAFEGAGEDRYLNACAGPASDHLTRDGRPEYVAVYKLVKVEKLKLEVSTTVVKAK